MKKKKTGRVLLSFLLTLAMVVGLMPGMGLTAWAANQSETLDTNAGTGSGMAHTYTGTHFKVEVNNEGDPDGFFVSSDGYNYGIVSALNGETITKLVIVRGCYNGEPALSSATAEKSADGDTFTFTNVNASSVTITCTGDTYCQIKQITIYYEEGSSTVEVNELFLQPSTASIPVGGVPLTLTLTVLPENATDKTVTWTTSDASVATVADGVVTAVAPGTATIIATATNGTDYTSDDRTATCTVTVTEGFPSVVNVTGVVINKTSTTLTVGGTETLTATVNPGDATDKSVTWSSDNTSVATVDANGKVTAVAAGTATITVTTTDGSKTATCSVTVNAADSDSDDDSSSNSSSNDSNNDSSKNNNSSNDSENSNSEPKAEPPYDYLEPLRGELKAEIALGGERTVTWDQGTALPYDIMKTLQDNPGVTLIFSYTYQGIDYKVTISGKDAKAYTEIPWYGPLYLYNHYGTLSETAPADTADTAIGTRTYTVIPGDTLSEIAAKLNTTVDSLVSLNDIKNRDFILVGQILKY